jgi:FKBP-type peptidyl-prolyl cis-trans isomerase
VLQKSWPLLVLIAVGLVTLVLIGLNTEGSKDGREDMTTTPSGLKYRDEVVGNGREAKAGDTVSVHYTGRLASNKKMFDSSGGKEPFTFTLGMRKVIQGWDEGIAGMKEGGKRTLLIPAELGYGATGRPPAIPPNADLEFDTELVKVAR